MSALPLRHRRLLSGTRRLGPHGASEALAGRAQRHALGWRDLNEPAPQRESLLACIGLAVVTWAVMGAMVVAAVRLLDWLYA